MNERYEQRPKPKDVETLRNLISQEDLREAFAIPSVPDQGKKKVLSKKPFKRLLKI